MSIRLTASLVLILLCPLVAHADDADISFGGSPRMLSGTTTTVTMQSEIVTLDVGADFVDVDCRFVFHNMGPACTIRMGFPDQGRGELDPTEIKSDIGHIDPTGTFRSFTSFVDDKPVTTSLVTDSQNPSDLWHVKVVQFGAGETVDIRDDYRQVVSSQVDSAPNYDGGTYSAFYILHTGSSWAGNIGRAEVIVNLHRPTLKNPALESYNAVGDPNPYTIEWNKIGLGTILWRGPSKPTFDGQTIRFVRTNFKPGYLDDVLLFFCR